MILPYSGLAFAYDQALGVPFFLGVRRAFEGLVRRYGVSFRSAADLGCGTGLFARYLSRCWRVRVFAVDRSIEMLEKAARNGCGSDVVLLRQDIRCLRLPKRVDLVTANFDTVNHLLSGEDIRQAFRRIADNLMPGGHFIFDVLTHCQHMDSRRTYVRHFRTKQCQVAQKIRWHPSRRALSVMIVQRCALCGPTTIEAHRERAYTPIELGRTLREAGFEIRGVHDATTLRPATQCVPRLLIVARKR
ncbi:MAG TPA: methyltransferase domain-containing protein [Nitrospiraceae bacterium]|nr:methyltransferase domain-containing protein [Nitrospiraceae bacterium]